MEKSNSRMEALKKYLSDDPSDDFSEYALALEFEKEGNLKNAILHLEKILERNAQYLAAYYQCGRLYEAEKNFIKAGRIYEKGMAVAAQQKNQKTFNELRTALEMLD